MAKQNGHSPDPGPTLGSVWRQARETGELVQLPTGAVARLRPVDLPGLVMAGNVPDVLTPTVMALIFENKQEDADALTDPVQISKWAKETMQLYNAVCVAAFVEPRIVDDPQAEDEIAIGDVEIVDRGFVFSVATQGVATLKSFRPGQAAAVELVSHGENDQPAAVDPPVD